MKLIEIITKSVCFIFLLSTFSCNNEGTNIDNRDTVNDVAVVKPENAPELIFETNPAGKKMFKIGDNLIINVNEQNNIQFDSIQFMLNKKLIVSVKKLPVEIKIQEKIEKPGIKNIEAFIYKKGTFTLQNHKVVYISDIEPKIFGFEIVKIYPHDRQAFTQGLLFDNGFLYEATGQMRESTIRKVQIATGEPIQSFTLEDPKIFGEGITIFNDKIIQLSWQNNIGFVYDKKSFQLLAKFEYTTEGWGITNDGKKLIMSDGTNVLYFLEPQSYSQVGQVEVYDNKGPVDQLNELEYINGEIYANIWQKDKIARIDPNSGKVLGYIDLSKILPNSDYQEDTDVLNGIAWDQKGKRLFVTGKKWPKLFEIKLK